MDFLTAGLGIVGLGLSIFGGMKQAENAQEQAAVSGQIAGDEQQVNAQKKQQMQLQSQRLNLENFRNVQKAKAQGLAAATNQGAQFGSGLEGGQAQATDQGLYNSLGINQNLEIGNNIFGVNNDISAKKMQLAALGGQAATDQGITSLGGSIMKAGPIIGAFGKNLTGTSGGGFGLGSLFMGGGTPSGL